MSEFTPSGGNRLTDREDIVEEVDMLCITPPVNASKHAVTYCCFHRGQSIQFVNWRSQVLEGMEKRKAFKDLDDCGKRVEAEEDIEMYRVLP